MANGVATARMGAVEALGGACEAGLAGARRRREAPGGTVARCTCHAAEAAARSSIALRVLDQTSAVLLRVVHRFGKGAREFARLDTPGSMQYESPMKKSQKPRFCEFDTLQPGHLALG